jgi:hypothetical protein
MVLFDWNWKSKKRLTQMFLWKFKNLETEVYCMNVLSIALIVGEVDVEHPWVGDEKATVDGCESIAAQRDRYHPTRPSDTSLLSPTKACL